MADAHYLAQMGRPRSIPPLTERAAVRARLHDIAAGVAIGISLLKAHVHGPRTEETRALRGFENALASLRDLIASSPVRREPGGQLADALADEARRLGIEVELRVEGDEGWLTDSEAELLRLAGREAIRNVHRHSGSRRCELVIDVSDCPFVLRIRDWGAGIGDAKPGAGFVSIQEMGRAIGAQLVIRSQAGMGTDFVLVGRSCPRNRLGPSVEARLRSGVGKESLRSRR